jgi:hypothetical protein
MAGLDRPTLYFDTWQYVYERASAKPYVGFEHLTDTPDGFFFDIKRWCSPFDLKLPTLPRLANPSTQGVDESYYFKCGVGNEKIDLIVDCLDEHYFDHERLWLPHVRHGAYFRYKTDYFYYSDNSVIQYVDSVDDVDGRNCLYLEREPMPGKPIMASSFKREMPSRAIVYDRRLTQVPAFSGEYVDGVEQSTYTPATKSIIWDYVDTTKREFVVDRHVADVIAVKFNRDYIEHIGVTPESLHDLGACDVLGQSDFSEYQSFYLQRFPVVPETFKLYVVDVENNTWEEWTRVETYHDLLMLVAESLTDPYIYGGKFYYLDRDLGRVLFGTTATGIPEHNRWIVAEYDVTLRIEYEEAEFSTEVVAWESDVNPVTQSVNQGFVMITHEPLEAAKITLTIDKAKLLGAAVDAYGPVYVGNDWAQLMATVTTISDTPVPNVEVEFHMAPQVGFLGGSSSGHSFGVTSAKGQAYSYYQPPLDANSIGYYATNPTSVGPGGWLQLDTTSTGLTMDDEIYLYQVLKDDPLLGMHSTYIEDYLPEPPSWADPDLSPVLYEQWVENTMAELNLANWQVNTTTGIPNGRKVIVYQWDDEATNPITGVLGAYAPVRPLEIANDGSRLQFPDGVMLPLDPVNPMMYNPYNHDIGAYWVVGSFYITFWATCWSPYYNKTIRSNEIRVKITLPRYLLGEHVNDELQKLPLGWKLYEDAEHNHAAGLDGATFLTINPHSGPYPIISWFGETPTDEWAQSITATVAFKITISTD